MTDTSPLPFPPLDWQTVASARQGMVGRVGSHIIYYPSVDSTNPRARTLLREGAAHGTVVVADEQTQGRGRLGRRWTAPPRSGLAVSVCLRPPAGFPLPLVTVAAALAVGDTVRAVVDVSRCTLKWPNDVLVDGRKVCGILVELDGTPGAWTVVVGIGLNVNAAPPLPMAISLASAVGFPMPREPLLIDLFAALEGYLDHAAAQPETVMGLWRDRLATLGRRVRVATPGGVLEGLAIDVDSDGALLLRLDDGTVRPLHAGDVSLASDE